MLHSALSQSDRGFDWANQNSEFENRLNIGELQNELNDCPTWAETELGTSIVSNVSILWSVHFVLLFPSVTNESWCRDQRTDRIDLSPALVGGSLAWGMFRNFGILFPPPDKSASAGSLSDISGSGSVKNTSKRGFQIDSDEESIKIWFREPIREQDSSIWKPAWVFFGFFFFVWNSSHIWIASRFWKIRQPIRLIFLQGILAHFLPIVGLDLVFFFRDVLEAKDLIEPERLFELPKYIRVIFWLSFRFKNSNSG